MSRKNRNGPANLEFFSQSLEGFASQYDIELYIFGDERLHWRLIGLSTTCDFWPTTGKYWVKDPPLNEFMSRYQRSGYLDHDYNKLDKFLKILFDKELT
jgi:hypothetical protein